MREAFKDAHAQFMEEIAEAARTNNMRFFIGHPHLYRGIGTTWKQVEAAPSGSIYVVRHSAMRHDVERILIRQGRAPKALDIRVVDHTDSVDRLRGLSRYLTVDHAVWATLTPEASESLLLAADMSNARYNRKQQAVAA